MSKSVFFALAAVGLLVVVAVQTSSASTVRIASTTVPLTMVGTSSFAGGVPSTDPAIDTTEIDQATMGDTDSSDDEDLGAGVDRPLPNVVTGNGRSVSPNKRAKSNPGLGQSWQGLNFHDQRFANGGNQLSVEPPDQGLCAGNGFVFEAVNDVLRVYNTDGTAATPVVDLNTFYGYPAAINRATGARGPSVTDPTCLYDQATNRFFFVVLTLDHVGTTASLSGTNHLDIAVSDTGDPTGTWTIYRLPVQNNGTQGTPDHHCHNGFCLGDYPHIGADANGIYLTTNEFAVFGSGFYGAQIYALSKAALAAGSPTVNVVLFNAGDPSVPAPAFTVWPAQSPPSGFSSDSGGTEYLLSSDAVFFDSGSSTEIWTWALTNTASLNTASPAPVLSVSPVTVQQYSVPPKATQKAGDHPLGACIATPACAALVGIPSSTAPIRNLDANDSRMQQVSYANGKIWGALDTGVTVGGQPRAGIAYYVLKPDVSTGAVTAKVALQGQLGVVGTDLTYPALAVLQNGRGVMGYTLTGDNDYPSAAYSGIDALVGAGDVHIAAAGVGPQDGFTQYPTAATRARWGDYGAAAVMGNSIWLASEYIAQTCTFAEYLAAPFGQCGGTRGSLGNWSTRISQVTP